MVCRIRDLLRNNTNTNTSSTSTSSTSSSTTSSSSRRTLITSSPLTAPLRTCSSKDHTLTWRCLRSVCGLRCQHTATGVRGITTVTTVTTVTTATTITMGTVNIITTTMATSTTMLLLLLLPTYRPLPPRSQSPHGGLTKVPTSSPPTAPPLPYHR